MSDTTKTVDRALAFVAEFQGDPRCALNCLHAEALAAEVVRLREQRDELLVTLKALRARAWMELADPEDVNEVAQATAAIAKAEGR